ncbi:MAG: flagellar export chaperone FlgN [Erysipelotrichaceae bacterium]
MEQQQFISFLERYMTCFERMVEDEKQRLEALISNDLTAIEKSISMQQANQMRLQSMEEQRMDLLEELGMPDATFQSVIATFEPATQQLLQQYYQRTSDAVALIKTYNQKSKELLELNLQMMQGTAPKATGYEALLKK